MKFEDVLRRWNDGLLRGAQVRLAKKMGVTEGLVSRWVSGEAMPGEEVRPKIAKELGISVNELISCLPKEMEFEKVTIPSGYITMTSKERRGSGPKAKAGTNVAPLPDWRVVMVPVVGTVSAERFHMSFDNPPEEFLPLGIPLASDKRCIALRIVGDCLKPTAYDGEYAYIVEKDHVDNGKLAVVRLNGEFTMKRVFRTDDVVELRPDNPRYKSIKVKPEELHVVGVVILIARKPNPL